VLVDAKADISFRDRTLESPLLLASFKKNVQAVKALLAAGADPNLQSVRNESALIIASHVGCLGAVAALIAARADVNHVNNKGSTPLSAAVVCNHVDVASALIAAGANVNYYTSNQNHAGADRTPLDIAYTVGADGPMTHMLRKAGGILWEQEISLKNDVFKVLSTGIGNDELIRKAVTSGSDIDRENALKCGVWLGRHAVVKYLLTMGLNPSMLLRETSLLSVACINGNVDIVRELVDAGADITVKDRSGMTALQWAVQFKRLDVLVLLMAKANKQINK
jgi:ankyrin repeat protein